MSETEKVAPWPNCGELFNKYARQNSIPRDSPQWEVARQAWDAGVLAGAEATGLAIKMYNHLMEQKVDARK